MPGCQTNVHSLLQRVYAISLDDFSRPPCHPEMQQDQSAAEVLQRRGISPMVLWRCLTSLRHVWHDTTLRWRSCWYPRIWYTPVTDCRAETPMPVATRTESNTASGAIRLCSATLDRPVRISALSKSSSRRATARRKGSGRVRKPHAWPTPSRMDASRCLLLSRVTADDFDRTLPLQVEDPLVDPCYHAWRPSYASQTTIEPGVDTQGKIGCTSTAAQAPKMPAVCSTGKPCYLHTPVDTCTHG